VAKRALQNPTESTKGELTPRQAAFVREYLIDRNGTQAAIRAGYSEKGAGVTASQLLTNPNVAKLVDAGTQRQAKKSGVTAEKVLRRLWKEATGVNRFGDSTASSRTAALGLLGKHFKMFTDQVHHTGNVSVIDPYAKTDGGSDE